MARETFHYHKVTDEAAIKQIESVRSMFICLADVLEAQLPESRSKSLALTYLEDSLMRAIQTLALDGGEIV